MDERLKDRLQLQAGKYCAEHDTYSVSGVMPEVPVDLQALATKARKLFPKVVFMPRLKVLYAVRAEVSVQVHEKGDILVNGLKNPDEAETVLEELIR